MMKQSTNNYESMNGSSTESYPIIEVSGVIRLEPANVSNISNSVKNADEKSGGNLKVDLNRKLSDLFLVPVDLESKCDENAERESGIDIPAQTKAKTTAKTIVCRIVSANYNITDIKESLKLLRDIADENKVWIICLRREAIAGFLHLEGAISHSVNSWFGSSKPISNSFEMETILYAAATKQCNNVGHFGFKKGMNSLYVCICVESDKSAADIYNDVSSNFKNSINLNNSLNFAFDKLTEIGFDFDPSQSKNTQNKNAIENKIDNKTENESSVIESAKMKHLMELFEISPEELKVIGNDALEEIILDRIALVDTLKKN